MTSANFVWKGDPIIFEIGPLAVRWYGVCFAAAFMCGVVLMQWIYRRESKPERDIDALLIYMMLGTIVGARLGEALFYQPHYFIANPWDIFKIWQGGLASHGAAIGILFTIYLYSRRKKEQPYLWLLSRLSIPTALAGSFIRLGNFFNSEILGNPSDLPWAIVFALRGENFPRHPTMLYESAAYFLIFLVLLAIYLRRSARTEPKTLLGLFFVLVFGARFLLEFTKSPQAEYAIEQSLDIFNMGQVLSVPIVVLGLALLLHKKSGRV